jgi:mannose-1-phosphate guanylyltransferase
MAGGSGTRFWPMSREKRSKQFLPILDSKSLLQSTVDRFSHLIKDDHIYIVARNCHQKILQELYFESQNLIFEPFERNTAPCIALAALHLMNKDPNAIMIVTPSDHLIRKHNRFRKAIAAAIRIADEKNGLVTIGIAPTHPATGYGYIQVDKILDSSYRGHTFSVKTFAEKPNIETAQRFLDSGDFYWNSGIFVFRAARYLTAVEEFLPDLYDGCMEIKNVIGTEKYDEVLTKVYKQIHPIAVDYGIMEKTNDIFLVKGDFVWYDLGNWDQVYRLSSKDKMGNAISGQALLIDTHNSYVQGSDGIVAVVGLDDVIVIQKDNALLICSRDKADEVNRIVDKLKSRKITDFI